MFFSPRPNVVESDEGYSVEVLDRDYLRYVEGPRAMKIYAEILMSPEGWVIYPDSIRVWDPPHAEEEIDKKKHDEIVENIRKAFRFWGYEISIYETELAYHGPWPEISSDELAIQMKEKRKKAIEDKKAGKELLGAKIIELNIENFTNEVLNSTIPVLVYFWMPAGEAFNYLMSPILEEASKEWAGRIKIGKLNYDNAGDIACDYKIVSIPTFILFKNGEPVKKIIGSWPRDAFFREFQDWL